MQLHLEILTYRLGLEQFQVQSKLPVLNHTSAAGSIHFKLLKSNFKEIRGGDGSFSLALKIQKLSRTRFFLLSLFLYHK